MESWKCVFINDKRPSELGFSLTSKQQPTNISSEESWEASGMVRAKSMRDVTTFCKLGELS